MSVSASAKKTISGQIVKMLVFEKEGESMYEKSKRKLYLRSVAFDIIEEFGISQKTLNQIVRHFVQKGTKFESSLFGWEDLNFATNLCLKGASANVTEETLSAVVRLGHRSDALLLARYLGRNLTSEEAFELSQRNLNNKRIAIGEGRYKSESCRPKNILAQAYADGVSRNGLAVLERQMLERGTIPNSSFLEWAKNILTSNEFAILEKNLSGHWSCKREAELTNIL